ncbi:MAG: type I restriction-modification system subunit M N-terminal domain-containing protein [Ardenticatenales bacterium]|nr:type I restriction-modification system subunit M N-terminal domain-containing protein [Ardenticatenales bacterium]
MPTRRGTAHTIAANIGCRAQLWKMTGALRGGMDAAEYKRVVLGLIFSKYISDTWKWRGALGILCNQPAAGQRGRRSSKRMAS